MANVFLSLSDTISRVVAASSAFLCAVRTAADRHVTGVLMQNDAIVTLNQSLPPLDVYTGFLASGAVVSCRRVIRDPVTDLAVLRPDALREVTPLTGILPPVGSLALVVAADPNGAPTARMTMIHRLVQTVHGLTPILDLPARCDPGAVVLDPEGRLIGLATRIGDDGTMAIPAASLMRLTGRGEVPQAAAEPVPIEPPAPAMAKAGGRAWLGLSLQPITVPDHLLSKAGQPSGRMVVNVIGGGPAERAGLQAGDVLLTLNGNSTSGANTLRAMMSSETIGSAIEVKLMRDGVLMVATLVVGAQPG